jgi:hypothetical protein
MAQKKRRERQIKNPSFNYCLQWRRRFFSVFPARSTDCFSVEAKKKSFFHSKKALADEFKFIVSKVQAQL